MFKILENILLESGLGGLFELKRKDDYRSKGKNFIAYRVKSNTYKIRGFELWGDENKYFFRIYHSDKINYDLREKLLEIEGVIKENNYSIDYRMGNLINIAIQIKDILSNTDIIDICKKDKNYSRISRFEGLSLPDIDISEGDVLGQTFTWREIISIWENDLEENNIKKELSKNGIYIQRSKDGTSRYIGSACGNGGIIGRWMKHLTSNGDARDLNLFVLENGYSEILFAVIEFYEGDDIIAKENIWKEILGTKNYGPYNSFQLNNN
ncbi:MAG: hypothetical protein ACRDCB_10605 [Clostridium sp.]